MRRRRDVSRRDAGAVAATGVSAARNSDSRLVEKKAPDDAGALSLLEIALISNGPRLAPHNRRSDS